MCYCNFLTMYVHQGTPGKNPQVTRSGEYQLYITQAHLFITAMSGVLSNTMGALYILHSLCVLSVEGFMTLTGKSNVHSSKLRDYFIRPSDAQFEAVRP